MEKRLTVLVPENMDGRMVKDVAQELSFGLSSTRLKKAKRIPRRRDAERAEVYVVERVHAGDTVSISIEDEAPSENVTPVEGEMDVRYEDEWLLVINKPAHMPVHPSAGHAQDSLANLAAAKWGGVFRPVNRLDGTPARWSLARRTRTFTRC